MAGGSVVSAIPDNLINYGIRATLLDGKISTQASTLGQALSAFIDSNPDPKYIASVPRLDQNVSTLASSARSTDDWVGRVGEAFKVAGQQEVSFLERHTGVTGLDAGAMPVTSTQATISTYAGEMESTFQADVKSYVAQQAYAQGQRDAKALIDAYNNPNTSDQQIQAIVQRLRSHLNDPNYCAGYFAALGPRRTLDLTSHLIPQGQGNFPKLPPGNPLQTFDQALASASHSSLLPPSFVTQVFPHYDLSKLGNSGQADETAQYLADMTSSTMLLRYGEYSRPFLAQALQTIVMPYMGTFARRLVGDSRLNPEVVQRNDIVFQALARNPVADAQVLGSQYQFTWDGRTFGGGSNIALILKAYGTYDSNSDSSAGGASLSAAIAAIARDPNTQDRMTVLKDIGSVSWQDDPDAARTGIATLLAHDIGNPAFLDHDNNPSFLDSSDPKLLGPQYLTWQEQLFIAATTNAGGSTNQISLKTIQAADSTWLAHNPPPAASSPDFSNWLHHYGALVGLTALGLRAGPYQSAADATRRYNFVLTSIDDALGVATAPLDTGPSIVVGFLIDGASTIVAGHAPTDLSAESRDLYLQSKTRAVAESYLVSSQIVDNPQLMPASVRAAYDQNPKSPAVQNFVAAVVQAPDIEALSPSYHWDSPRQQQQMNTLIEQVRDLHGQVGDYFNLKFN